MLFPKRMANRFIGERFIHVRFGGSVDASDRASVKASPSTGSPTASDDMSTTTWTWHPSGSPIVSCMNRRSAGAHLQLDRHCCPSESNLRSPASGDRKPPVSSRGVSVIPGRHAHCKMEKTRSTNIETRRRAACCYRPQTDNVSALAPAFMPGRLRGNISLRPLRQRREGF